MGASDSKLVFKQGIFKLCEQKEIAADDEYWTGVRASPLLMSQLLTSFPVLGAARDCRGRLHAILTHRYPEDARPCFREPGDPDTGCLLATHSPPKSSIFS